MSACAVKQCPLGVLQICSGTTAPDQTLDQVNGSEHDES